MNRFKKFRIVTGSILTVLSLILTGDILTVMTHRIKTVEIPLIYKKNLFADMLLCTALTVSSLDLALNLFTRSKNPFLKFIGWNLRISFLIPSAACLYSISLSACRILFFALVEATKLSQSAFGCWLGDVKTDT